MRERKKRERDERREKESVREREGVCSWATDFNFATKWEP